jgi:hypothetical protein
MPTMLFPPLLVVLIGPRSIETLQRSMANSFRIRAVTMCGVIFAGDLGDM